MAGTSPAMTMCSRRNALPHPNDPKLRSFIPVDPVSDFPIQNLELGVFSAPSLNPFMALGPRMWTRTRARISELLRHDHPELRDNEELRKQALVPMRDAKLHLPFAVSGYTDFYSSKEHATNVGVMF